jgi:hypothetical protein
MFAAFPSDPLYLIAGLVVGWLVLLLSVALYERHLVMPYVPSPEGFQQAETPYSTRANTSAEALGFHYLGPYHHAKGGIYQIRYWIWASPELDSLAIVSGGTMARIPYDGTRIVSGLEDGRFVLTIDNPSLGQLHSDGLAVGSTFMGVDLPTLVAHHRAFVRGQAIPFDATDPVGHLVEWRTELADRLVEAGFAHYLDEGQTVWRYTIRGAFRRIARSLGIQSRVIALNRMGLPTGRSPKPSDNDTPG